MNARTKVLFHFTGLTDGFNILQQILKDRAFLPKYVLEDTTWIGSGIDSLALPMVCFCDIPLLRILQHTDVYGGYGIGLNQDWGESWGMNPVLYVSDKSVLKNYLLDLCKKPNPNNFMSSTDANVVLAHCKPFRGKCAKTGLEKDFYSECEWRSVNFNFNDDSRKYGFLTKEKFNDSQIILEANEEQKEFKRDFGINEIKYLLVKKLDDIPTLVDFITKQFSEYCDKDVKTLITRIRALDEIHSDH